MRGRWMVAALVTVLTACPMLGQGIQISQAPFTGGVLTSAITLPAGSGTATYKPSGVIHVNTTQTGTTAVTTEETLWTYTLPANTLSANGQSVRITIAAQSAANANAKSLRLYFGGTVIESRIGGADNATAYRIQYTVTRVSATSQLSSGWMMIAGGVDSGFIETPAETLTGNVIIKLTGQNGTANANDLVLKSAVVEYLPY